MYYWIILVTLTKKKKKSPTIRIVSFALLVTMTTWHTSGKWYIALQCQLKKNKKIGVWWSKLKQKFWLFFVEPKGYYFQDQSCMCGSRIHLFIYLFIARREIIHLIIHFIFMLVDHIASFGSDRVKPPLMIGTTRKRPLMSFSWKRPVIHFCDQILQVVPQNLYIINYWYQYSQIWYKQKQKQKEKKKIIKSKLCCFFFLS